MTTYIQLFTLTPQGREKALQSPEGILAAQDQVKVAGVQVLGLYAVLGAYDFVGMVEAPDNDSVARYSLELGVLAGVTIITLPAIPIARMEGSEREPSLESEPTSAVPDA